MDVPPALGHEEPDEKLRSEPEATGWRVDVTNVDVREAKHRWLVADDGGGPDALIDLLYQDYVHVISAQAQQIADDLRWGRASLA